MDSEGHEQKELGADTKVKATSQKNINISANILSTWCSLFNACIIIALLLGIIATQFNYVKKGSEYVMKRYEIDTSYIAKSLVSLWNIGKTLYLFFPMENIEFSTNELSNFHKLHHGINTPTLKSECKKIKIKWEKTGYQGGYDVTILQNGRLVVTASESKMMHMYDLDGNSITESKLMHSPRSLAHFTDNSTLLMTYHMRFLVGVFNQHTLDIMDYLELGGHRYLCNGIAILSSGQIVTLLTQFGVNPKQTLSIFDSNGKLLRKIKTLECDSDIFHITGSTYNHVTVDKNDNIILSLFDRRQVVIVGTDGQCEGVIPVEHGDPVGLTVTSSGQLILTVQGDHQDTILTYMDIYSGNKPDILVKYKKNIRRTCGTIMSVAQVENKLAVIFESCLKLYQCL